MSTRIHTGKWYWEMNKKCEYCNNNTSSNYSKCKQCMIKKVRCKHCLENMIISDIKKICLNCLRDIKINTIVKENYEH